METELALAAFGAGMTALECTVAYFGIVKPYRDAKKEKRVSSFSEYWSRGMERFREVLY